MFISHFCICSGKKLSNHNPFLESESTLESLESDPKVSYIYMMPYGYPLLVSLIIPSGEAMTKYYSKRGMDYCERAKNPPEFLTTVGELAVWLWTRYHPGVSAEEVAVPGT